MESQVLGEKRRLIVHLPESYERESERRYPVVYVLDGSSHDVHTAGSAALLARDGMMPEVIVVALPNVSGGRPRDYTPPFIRQDTEKADSPMGRSDRFLEFLKKELIPHVEAQYRTAPFRMLAGHSRGGLFVGWSLIADPELFQARFAHSPTFHREDNIMANKFADFLKGSPPPTFFYMSVGTKENPGLTAGFDAVREVFAAHAPKNFRWQADRTADADHGNNAQLATPVGFRALYRTGGN
jgi:predicted alpha/beta superfamily hydrolase